MNDITEQLLDALFIQEEKEWYLDVMRLDEENFNGVMIDLMDAIHLNDEIGKMLMSLNTMDCTDSISLILSKVDKPLLGDTRRFNTTVSYGLVDKGLNEIKYESRIRILRKSKFVLQESQNNLQ